MPGRSKAVKIYMDMCALGRLIMGEYSDENDTSSTFHRNRSFDIQDPRWFFGCRYQNYQNLARGRYEGAATQMAHGNHGNSARRRLRDLDRRS